MNNLEFKKNQDLIISILAWIITTIFLLFKQKKLVILLNDLQNKAFFYELENGVHKKVPYFVHLAPQLTQNFPSLCKHKKNCKSNI